MKFFLKVSLILSFILHPLICEAQENTTAQYSPPIIRVAVIKQKEKLTLSITRPFKILALNTHQVLHQARRLRNAEVKPASSGIKVDDEEFMIYGIKIMPTKDATIYINKRKFRGNVDIIREKDQTLLVVNYINVEDYLKGVLYHEVSHWWPKEALRAQAIVARTFALYQASVNKDKDYDVTCDIYSQVYGGATSEKFRATRAINRTRGKVLTYKGKIFPAYYHATCGGHTEDASVLWNTNLPVLKGTKCGFCKRSPHYNWQLKLPLSQIQETLRKKGFIISSIKSIEPKKIDNSGRILKLKITSKEKPLLISAKEFRQFLGPNLIRSTNFKVKIDDIKMHAIFEGIGWGHGVGMCQWGAHFMSKKKYTAGEILEYYYPKSEITQIAK